MSAATIPSHVVIPASASGFWQAYCEATQELIALHCDPNATSQRRADAALVAHRAERAFKAAFDQQGRAIA